MTTPSIEELVNRFLKITKNILYVVEEKNWVLLNHFIIERNDIIQFLDPQKERVQSNPNLNAIMQEAMEVQNEISKKMEQYWKELFETRLKARQIQQASIKYQKQVLFSNYMQHNR